MHNDDREALAAEYVLGTLSADEREHAEGLLLIDPGIELAVRHWERRLGELNVMVEAVEPPADIWEKIKLGMSPSSGSHAGEEAEVQDTEEELPHLGEAAAQAPEAAEVLQKRDEAEASEGITTSEEGDKPALVETSEPPEQVLEETAKAEKSEEASTAPEVSAAMEESRAVEKTEIPSARPEPKEIERSADVVYLARRLRGLRRIALMLGALAAVLAIYIAVWQIAPLRIPPQLWPAGARMAALPAQPPVRFPQDRLVAALQQEPTAPAFLLTLDTRHRMLIVRNISATPVTGRSYELWLIANRFSRPQPFGVVGDGKFTQRALPASYDAATLGAASYAVSLEPAGGSPSGVPTGPILFTGKAVESVPGSPPS